MNENMKRLEGCSDMGKVGLTSSLREVGQCWKLKIEMKVGRWMNLRTLVELVSRNGIVGESKIPSRLGEVRQWMNFGKVAQLLDPKMIVELVGFTWQKTKVGLLSWLNGPMDEFEEVGEHIKDVEVGPNPLGKLNPRNWCWAQCC